MFKRFILFSLLFLFSVQPGYTQVGLFIRPNSSSLSAPVQGQTWLFNSTNNTMQVYNGSIFQVASAPQNNFSAMTAPTSANDQTQGYSPGSEWYNTTNGFVYTCVSAATTAAVWVQINNLGSLSIPLTSLQAGGAAAGQSLLFNGTNWAPGNPLISLNNVLQTGALIGQVPIWNGTNWVPTNPTTVTGTGLSIANKNTSFTATTNTLYLVTLTASDVITTLPDATSCPGQQLVVVLNTGSSTLYFLKFATTGGQLINNNNFWYGTAGFNGGTAVTVNTFISNGTNWNVTQGGDMLAALFTGTYFGSTNTGEIAMSLSGNTIQLQPILNPHTVSTDSMAFGMNSYFVDTSGGDVLMTLPDAGFSQGQMVSVILSVTGNNINFASTSGQTINGAAPGSLTPLSGSVGFAYCFISDGSNWFTMASH